MIIEKYHDWQNEKGEHFVPVPIEGSELIRNQILNKGTAFTERERKELGLTGLLPPHTSTIEDQIRRTYEGFSLRHNNLEKYLFLRSLQDRNETLFYALVSKYIEEMIPIIYTPTVGTACQQFSHLYTNARGLYITHNNVSKMHDMLHHFPSRNIKIIVVTDNQGILGIGDQGVGGMGIPIGKLSLYVLGAGISPADCLPITLDVGTDNETLLKDPLYLGLKRKRIVGDEYEEFIKKFITNIKEYFPDAILQWEDFSKAHAFTNLENYREFLPSFNDDIQGTGAVILAGIINAMKAKKEDMKNQKYCVFGAGAGGVGVAKQIHSALVHEGLSAEEAYAQIYIIGSKGVEYLDRTDIEDYKKPFAKDRSITKEWQLENPEKVTLLDLVKNEKITVLLGLSGQKGEFTENIVRQMLTNSDRPVIFPASNPTSKCEAVPEDIYRWTDGKAIVATGSPFPDLKFKGDKIRIGQGNNVFIFPAIGLAAMICKAKTINDSFFTTAAYALADYVDEKDIARGTVFPEIAYLKEVSIHVATKILEHYYEEKPDPAIPPDDIPSIVKSHRWEPVYLPYKRV